MYTQCRPGTVQLLFFQEFPSPLKDLYHISVTSPTTVHQPPYVGSLVSILYPTILFHNTSKSFCANEFFVELADSFYSSPWSVVLPAVKTMPTVTQYQSVQLASTMGCVVDFLGINRWLLFDKELCVLLCFLLLSAVYCLCLCLCLCLCPRSGISTRAWLKDLHDCTM